MPSNYKPIGDYIRLVDERNKELKVTTLLGLSISKEFIPSVANTVGTNMRNYKIIRKNQFACSIMQVRRDGKMPVALLEDIEEAIISQAYPVFEIIDTEVLLPQYLMMWFSRSEFDRQATFHAVGGVRGSLEWEDFLAFELPVPSIEKQREIVREYNVVNNRIKLNEGINQKLEETAQALYKHWFIDFEFPNKEGKPYKSSEGKMVYNEELDKEIPEGWEVLPLKKLTHYSKERINIKELNLENYISTENMLPEKNGITTASNLPDSKTVTKFTVGDILISNIRPYFKKIWKANFTGGCSNDIICFKLNGRINSTFLYHILEQDIFFDYVMSGSKGTKMPRGDKNWIMKYLITIPLNDDLLNRFASKTQILFQEILIKRSENFKMEEIKSIVLSKMATIEESLYIGYE